jgi:hypothetical protein
MGWWSSKSHGITHPKQSGDRIEKRKSNPHPFKICRTRLSNFGPWLSFQIYHRVFPKLPLFKFLSSPTFNRILSAHVRDSEKTTTSPVVMEIRPSDILLRPWSKTGTSG